ncbi:synaptotagmin-4-like [Antedon mediterranea]|uniref:synaptotagmin-4-like n=1 Tax=Antedon mediterranea TaxID=105859 RepID=UPI003AF9AA57
MAGENHYAGDSYHNAVTMSSTVLVGIFAASFTVFIFLVVGFYHYCRRRKQSPFSSNSNRSYVTKSYCAKTSRPPSSPESLSSPEFPSDYAPSMSSLHPSQSFSSQSISSLERKLTVKNRTFSGSTGSMIDPTTLNKDCYSEDGFESSCAIEEAPPSPRLIEPGALGELDFTVEYNSARQTFLVTIHKASNLPKRDPLASGCTSDPYVKLYLLPEKKHKVKTRVMRKTSDPVYEETFSFYNLEYYQLQGITLHFVIMSFDRFSRDQLIGEVVVSTANVDLGQGPVHMTKDITPRKPRVAKSQGRGELLVSLGYQPALNKLTVVVLKAKNLPKMDVTGLSDPYVKMYLMYGTQRLAKKKTRLKKRTLNPVFNESFMFDVPIDGLENIHLEFHVLDHDRVTKNEIIGRLNIGKNANELEAKHWDDIVQNPRRQFAEWHALTA